MTPRHRWRPRRPRPLRFRYPFTVCGLHQRILGRRLRPGSPAAGRPAAHM